MKTRKYVFLLIWGLLIFVAGILSFFSPPSTISLFQSFYLLGLMSLTGVAFILSFFLINYKKAIGKYIALVAFIIDLCYYVVGVIYLLSVKPFNTGFVFVSIAVLIFMARFARYIYMMLKAQNN